MKIIIRRPIFKPLEEGKIYKTKFATGELFFLSKIKTDKQGNVIGLEGVYQNSKHLGNCPLSSDRLIPEPRGVDAYDEIECCFKCGEAL